MEVWTWTWIALVGSAAIQDSDRALGSAPQLRPDMAALTSDIVVYGTQIHAGDIIATTIRSPDPDLSALTAGLVSGGMPDRSEQADEAMRVASGFTAGREARTGRR